MSDVVWLGAGLIGFRKTVTTPKKEENTEPEEVYQEGAMVALRKGGDEVLFARSDDDSRDPLEWIPVGDFVANPVAIATEDDFLEPSDDEGETEVEGVEVARKSSGPSGRPGVRRRKE